MSSDSRSKVFPLHCIPSSLLLSSCGLRWSALHSSGPLFPPFSVPSLSMLIKSAGDDSLNLDQSKSVPVIPFLCARYSFSQLPLQLGVPTWPSFSQSDMRKYSERFHLLLGGRATPEEPPGLLFFSQVLNMIIWRDGWSWFWPWGNESPGKSQLVKDETQTKQKKTGPLVTSLSPCTGSRTT